MTSDWVVWALCQKYVVQCVPPCACCCPSQRLRDIVVSMKEATKEALALHKLRKGDRERDQFVRVVVCTF